MRLSHVKNHVVKLDSFLTVDTCTVTLQAIASQTAAVSGSEDRGGGGAAQLPTADTFRCHIF